MMHGITREQYMANPCGACSTAYWKNEFYTKPDHIRIVHRSEFIRAADERVTEYFRLIHRLESIDDPMLDNGLAFRDVDTANELRVVSAIINRCYNNMDVTPQTVSAWTRYPAFDAKLWVYIIDTAKKVPAALGIADFDVSIGEGSLEWIQVLPEYRACGLGLALVNELLRRLNKAAEFVTVSGEVKNTTHPEALYRRCGFTGDDIWCVAERTDWRTT